MGALRENYLEEGLDKLLQIIEETQPLPAGCDRDQVLETLKNAVMEAFDGRVPEDLFRDEEMVNKLKIVAHTAVMETMTNTLAEKLMAANSGAEMSPKQQQELIDTCKNLIKMAVKMQTGREPDAKETDRLMTAMLKDLQAEMKKSPRPSPRADKKEAGVSDEDDYNAQMFGVTKSHVAIVLQRTVGNTMGASDVAVLQSTAAMAGFMFRIDNTAATTLSPDARVALDARLTAISGSFEAAYDALSSVASSNRNTPRLEAK